MSPPSFMQNRIKLAEYFNEQGARIGAEVGVEAGIYSEVLCQKNPQLTLYCIDGWGKGEERYRYWHRLQRKKAQERLAPYNTNVIHEWSTDAAKRFPKEYFDFVYIDANHSFDSAMIDIITWTPLVKKGGIVSGHDYGTSEKCGVQNAVDYYTKQHGYTVTVTDEADGGGRSWYFTKT